MKTVELGDRVKDRVTGYKGIVVSVVKYLQGCDRCGVQAEELSDGKPAEWQHFDVTQLKVLKKAVHEVVEVTPQSPKTGGPRPDAPSR